MLSVLFALWCSMVALLLLGSCVALSRLIFDDDALSAYWNRRTQMPKPSPTQLSWVFAIALTLFFCAAMTALFFWSYQP